MRNLVATLLLAGAIAGCGSAPGVALDSWTRDPSFTTCNDWLVEMTSDQRERMAAELLGPMRRVVDSAATDAPELAEAFALAIGDACASDFADDDQVVAAAAFAFLMVDDGARFGPGRPDS